MDYLDPKKQFRHHIILMVGYVFVGVAILFATLILLYQAYGFGIGDNGSVIQNGLVFFSSQPTSAQIYVNGTKKAQTNSRVLLPAGLYQIKLSQTGYRDWSRSITVSGGSVIHYDYPILFPTNLKTTKLSAYSTPPTVTTQSPDKRWLLVQSATSVLTYDVYDLKNLTQAPSQITLPANIVTRASSSESWQVLEWADDNQHFLLQHNFDAKTEYLLIDRQTVANSENLNNVLAINPTKLSFHNSKFDQYYAYDAAAKALMTVSLSAPKPVSIIDGLQDYKTYANDYVLYITDTNAPTGKVLLELYKAGQSSIIRTFTANSNYLLNINDYSGSLYVTAGAVVDNKIYVYKDPLTQLRLQPTHPVVPIQVLHVTNPDYLSFSPNSQYVVAEHANQFAIFDIENRNGYDYNLSPGLDKPQIHASWMNDSHLTYVANGKTLVFDYDGANQQALASASANYLPFFAPDYKSYYQFNTTTTATNLNQSSLVAQ